MVLIVEGVTDERLYSKFMDLDNAQVIVAHSKENVRHSVKECYSKRKDEKVIGIVDADLDRVCGIKREAPIFVTDCRDGEMMMIHSTAFYDVLSEYMESKDLVSFEKINGNIRSTILEAVYPVGVFMHISRRDGMNLSFKNLEPQFYVSEKTLKPDIRKLVNEVLFRSNKTHIDPYEISKMILSEMKQGYNKCDMCRGHDAVSVMLMFLHKHGSFNCRGLCDGEMSGALRLAFGKDEFRDTELYKSVKNWCSSKDCKIWSF